MVKDPVCGMEIDEEAEKILKEEYQGNEYCFCSDDCRTAFKADPEKYMPPH